LKVVLNATPSIHLCQFCLALQLNLCTAILLQWLDSHLLTRTIL
jgi:hypothetical protein